MACARHFASAEVSGVDDIISVTGWKFGQLLVPCADSWLRLDDAPQLLGGSFDGILTLAAGSRTQSPADVAAVSYGAVAESGLA